MDNAMREARQAIAQRIRKHGEAIQIDSLASNVWDTDSAIKNIVAKVLGEELQNLADSIDEEY